MAASYGRGAMTNHFTDYQNTDVFLVIGNNPAENHPLSMKWINRAREKGAVLIVVDPRMNKTAAHADIFARIRPGTDIAFLNGLINYVLSNQLYNADYLLYYTNASYLINEQFSFADGVFSGLTNQKGQQTYDNTTWQYQGNGEQVKKDLSMTDPHCVLQHLIRHVQRYDLDTVSNVTGIKKTTLAEVYQTFGATGQRDKAGNIIWAMGICQHTHGTQNVRAINILQLLLGNIGVAGGGANAHRGESNVQGSTDMGMLNHNLPGYLDVPYASKHSNLQAYLDQETPATSYWNNKPKFLISMLKAWYGEHATPQNDFCYDWLPKHDGQNRTHMGIFEKIAAGDIKGMFAWGQNPAVGGPMARAERKAMEQLDWLVTVDLFETETASFWQAPDVNPADIKTECFLLPASYSYEKEGTVTNSGRWIQYRWPAVDPLGQAQSDAWIIDQLVTAVQKLYRQGGIFPDPVINCLWQYKQPGREEPDIGAIALEINGYDTATQQALDSFAKLKDDGSTACGCWIYTGYWYTDGQYAVPNCQRRINEDKSGIGSFGEWSFAWPANRRILYNRCAVDANGRPWNPAIPVVAWNGAKWKTNDVPDFAFKDTATGQHLPPEKSVHSAFIMLPEGQGRVWAADIKDGPLPEHYEPVESPVKNLFSKQQNVPVMFRYQGEFAKANTMVADGRYPIIATTHRVVEHYQSGAVTRNVPVLAETMPEMFISISPGLAQKLNIAPGDFVWVESVRGKIKCRASVLPVVKPLLISGKEVEVVGMPWHFGYQGLITGATANDLTPCTGDPNTGMPEYKAFMVNITKA